MFKKSLLLISILGLGSCAYALEGHLQDVKIVTPGADNARCDVYVEGLRYRSYPPQTINVKNSPEDLVVDCYAPGNRHKKIFVRPMTAKTADANLFNFGVGFAFDKASKALYKYPDVIEVNFTDAQTVAPALPKHNNPDVRQPEDYPLEEFSPSQPKLNSDKYLEEPELKRRGSSGAVQTESNMGDAFMEPSGSLSGKGNLQTIPGQ